MGSAPWALVAHNNKNTNPFIVKHLIMIELTADD
jgi:hypothetical protein